MKDSKAKKEILAQYKEREVIGGVYSIRNTVTDTLLVETSTDLQGSKNRFAFAQQTDMCFDMKLRNDWSKQGGGQFAFEVLEELKKGETQTAEEFKADLEVLKGLWLEKLAGRELY